MRLTASNPNAILWEWAFLNASPSTRCSVAAAPALGGMRIRVSDVLDLLDSGLSQAAILEEMPDLEADDIRACLRFARQRIDHPILAENPNYPELPAQAQSRFSPPG